MNQFIKRSVMFIVLLSALLIFGRMVLFVGVLFRYVFVPILIALPFIILYGGYYFYKNAPDAYDKAFGYGSRRFTTDAAAEDGDCDICGQSSDVVEIRAKEFVLNGRAFMEVRRSETPFCDEHHITPDDVGDLGLDAIERELEDSSEQEENTSMEKN